MTMGDAEAATKAAKLFDVLMGNDVATRKDYIVTHSAFVDSELLDI